MTGDVVGGTRATGTVSCLGLEALIRAGTVGHTVTGGAEYTFKFRGAAFRAFWLNGVILAHEQELI